MRQLAPPFQFGYFGLAKASSDFILESFNKAFGPSWRGMIHDIKVVVQTISYIMQMRND